MGGLQDFIALTTPQYLLIAVVSPLASFMILGRALPGPDFIPVIASLCFAVLWFNSINSIFDIEIDRIDKPLRPLPASRMSVNEARILSFIFVAASASIAVFVSAAFFYLMTVFVVVSYAYSALFLKRYIWGSPITGAVLYGAIPFLSVYTVSNEFSLLFFLLFTAMFAVISTTKDFEDINSQKRFRLRSLPLVIGFSNAKAAVCWSILALIYLFIAMSLLGIIDGRLLLPSVVCLLAYLAYTELFRKELKKLDSTRKKNITTQSPIPTISIIFVLLVQLIFGVFAVIAG